MENACVNDGFSSSQLEMDDNSDIGNGESEVSSVSFSSTTNQQRIIRNGIGASCNLENPYRDSSYMKEGSIMSFQLPTGKKGFIGDIGFSFSGAENDCLEQNDWEAVPILIESVTRGSIAEKAGLEPGDEIIKINAVTVEKAARSLPVTLIKNCDKKMRMIVRKGKGANRAENMTFGKDQIQEFFDAFSLYDRSNKRKILAKDFPKVCRILGYNETALALDDALSAARTKTGEPDGEKVCWDTFLQAMKEILKHQDVKKDSLTAYAVFDPGRKGHFSIRQLRDAFLMSCKAASPLEMAEIFRIADPDLDGRVHEKEFMKLLYPIVEMY